MGSKNLKAIAVRGFKGVKIAHPDRFEKATKTLLEGVKETGAKTSTYDRIWWLHNNGNMLCTKHHQSGWWENADKLDPENFYRKHVVSGWSNFCCGQDNHGFGCNPIYKIKEGPYKGTIGSVEFEGIAALGSAVANQDLDSVIKANELADTLGMDNDSCGRVISYAMELYQRGIITDKDVGFPLKWGDGEAVIKLMHMIVKREGFGNILAEGEARAGKIIDKGAEKYSLTIKGLEQHEDGRANIGMALAQAVSTRGSDHLRGDPPEIYGVPVELIDKMFGIKAEVNQFQYENKPFMVMTEEIHSMLTDSLEICKRYSFWQSHVYSRIKDIPPGSLYAELFSSATGVEMDAREILKSAERTYNLERAFIVREGAKRDDDYQPWRAYTEPLPTGSGKGHLIDREKFSHMLDEYYELHGWDKTNGVPKEEKLKELNLEYVATQLKKLNIT
jgi:aldehyde:ferredoxin oxidoreductase